MNADARNINSTGQWIRSSRCGPTNGNCLELNHVATEVIIRDSKGDTGEILVYDQRSWSSFLERCRSSF